MDALALACPVVCVDRTGGGITSFNVDSRFGPYVSIGQSERQQRARLTGWLSASPFPAGLLAELPAERGGTRRCADLIEALSSGSLAWSAPRRRAWSGRAGSTPILKR